MPFRELVLARMQLDPDVHEPSPADQRLEEAIREALGLIRWADHLVGQLPCTDQRPSRPGASAPSRWFGPG